MPRPARVPVSVPLVALLFVPLLGALALLPACGEEARPGPQEGLLLQPKEEVYRHSNVGPTALRFEDVSAGSGLTAVNHSGRAGVKEYLPEAVGTGPAWLDFDGDGFLDLYLPDGDVYSNYVLVHENVPGVPTPVARLKPKSPKPEPFLDRLYRGRGDGTFEDVTEQAGIFDDRWSFGATAFDYDGDGLTDIFVANYGENRLWRNNGDGTFTDVAARVGVAGDAGTWHTCAAVGDFNGNGRLDIYVGAYSDPAHEIDRQRIAQGLPLGTPVESISGRACRWKGIRAYCGPLGLAAQDDRLYLQQADGTFKDATEVSGMLPRGARYAFTVLAFDFNASGRLDAYVANDSVENFLWQNMPTPDGSLRFRDTSDILGVKLGHNQTAQASMGAAVADINQDGLLDIFVTNFSHDYNNIYLGQRAAGDPSVFFFRDRGLQIMGTSVWYDLSWGCGWYDFDNDGDLDLYFANGHVYKEADLFEVTETTYDQFDSLFECVDAKTSAYREVGPKAQAGAPAGIKVEDLDAGPGMHVRKCSRGAAFADFDNDGRMDVLVQQMNETYTLLRNVAPTEGRNWVKIVLRQPGLNHEALGAVVQVEATPGGPTQTFPILRLTSFLGTDDPRLHVGLGAATRCTVRVTWPGGGEPTVYEGVEAGSLWRLDRESGAAERVQMPVARR